MAPRVFLSYARKDGEAFATRLRQRLERDEPEITLWQDRAQMEGGVGWWKQITDALDAVEFMVLVVTPGALASGVVQKEWRYARQQGVCVYPVKAAPDADLGFDAMPGWMATAHFYDLDHQWETFVLHLKSPCQAVRIPFMAPDLPDHSIERPVPLESLLASLLDAGRANLAATTAALYGAGGFGKTTLAAQLCHREEVVTAATNGVLWATLGERPNVLAELTSLYAALTGERPHFVNEDDAANALAQKTAEHPCFVVIDDVWNAAHLAALKRATNGCTRLLTTRQLDIALDAAQPPIAVDEMTAAEATALLTTSVDVPAADRAAFEKLAGRLGKWPLLLELAGGALRRRLAGGDTLAGALAYLGQAVAEEGALAFDQRNPQQRRQAVAKTLAVSLDLLTADERRWYRSLGIFPEDAAVPLSAVAILLGLSDYKTQKLAGDLHNLSLLKLDLGTATLRLHDVMRAVLAGEIEDAPALHARLADAWSAPAALKGPYAWRFAVFHHTAALAGNHGPEERHRRTRRLVELVTDPAFREGHSRQVGDPPALCRDLESALRCAVDDLHADGPALVLRAALVVADYEGLPPSALFDLAREGRLERAEPFLALFEPEEAWRQAALLTLAWTAFAAGHAQPAAELVDRLVHGAWAGDPVLRALRQRVQSVLDPAVPPPPSSLPAPPDLFTVTQILERLGGTAMTPIEPLAVTGLADHGDEAPAYLAEQDGPLLVALAEADREHHTPTVKRYIALQASNPYSYYRNRSLWALIPSIVQHSNPAWILDILGELMTGALTRTRIDFRSALPLTVRALRASQGDAQALQELAAERAACADRLRHLSAERGEGDPWAHEVRRMAAFAEIDARVLGRPADAGQLLRQAVALPFHFNFAGFRAPAFLTLAESSRVCGDGDPAAIAQALDQAASAAQNIQDPAFALQMTARVNAMTDDWWPHPPAALGLAALVAAIASKPGDATFAAVHRVGDTFLRRSPLPTRLPLPHSFRQARTLHDVAGIYRLPETAILAFHPTLRGRETEPLPVGMPLWVPDPDFLPFLAARLAAEALAAPGLSAAERTALIQRLIPLAVENRTALDTVASRLLLAALPQDVSTLAALGSFP